MIPRDILIHHILPFFYYIEDSETLKNMGVTEEDADKWCYHVQPHGEFKEYYSTGVLSIHYFFKEGKRHGDHRHYFSTGKERVKSCYKDGKLNGEYKDYYLNGCLHEHSFYIDGSLHGACKFYNSDGSMSRSIYYINYPSKLN